MAAQIAPLADPLPARTLETRTRLPLRPDPVTLSGRVVRLEPLVPERSAPSLFTVSNGAPVSIGTRRVDADDADALIWRFMFDGPFRSVEDLTAALRQRIASVSAYDQPSPVCRFCTESKSSPSGAQDS